MKKITMEERQTPYVFFREDGFYPILMKDDEDAIANALCNPGTLRVEDLTRRIIWEVPKQ